MIELILFIIIGIKLDIMNGWYLALVISEGFLVATKYAIAFYKAGRDN